MEEGRKHFHFPSDVLYFKIPTRDISKVFDCTQSLVFIKNPHANEDRLIPTKPLGVSAGLGFDYLRQYVKDILPSCVVLTSKGCSQPRDRWSDNMITWRIVCSVNQCPFAGKLNCSFDSFKIGTDPLIEEFTTYMKWQVTLVTPMCVHPVINEQHFNVVGAARLPVLNKLRGSTEGVYAVTMRQDAGPGVVMTHKSVESGELN